MKFDRFPLPQRESAVLQHADGRELKTKIVKGRKITRGGFGDIYHVDVEIGNKNIPFILKEYRANLAQEHAERAFNNYKTARDAGLKVWKTFRLVKDRASILMTNGLLDETICVSSNEDRSTTVEAFGSKKLKSIGNFDKLLEGVFQQAILGYEKNLYMGSDCFLFLLNRRDNHVDFVIGDMDFVTTFKNPNENDKAENMYGAYNALRHMIMNNVKNNSRLISKLTARFQEKMSELNLPSIYQEP